MKFDSNVKAIVSGGVSGLGRAVADRVVAAGGKVAMLDINEEAGKAAQQALGANALFVKTDVSSETSVDDAVKQAVDAFGGVNLAVNCAGILGAGRVLGKQGPMASDVFAKVIHVNLMGTFNLSKAAAAAMEANAPGPDGERGLIVGTASVAAYEGQIGQAAYSASKGGVVGLTLPAARDLARLGIRVCTIAPGLFDTPLLAALPQEARDALGASIPFPPRLGRPEEYAKLACHIAENTMLNGEVLRLDGALRMAPK
jgi:NAD(P)-dependent dehydrogenase (short-subunit alcohol dehydrogenase family)